MSGNGVSNRCDFRGECSTSQKRSKQKTSSQEPYASSVSKLIENGKLLLQAVKSGNESLVEHLLNIGVPPYISDQLGCNSLYYAARFNHTKIVDILLKAGGEVNSLTKMKRSPLQIASYHGRSDIVRILITNGANINHVDCLKMTALHWAAENNHIETAEILLKAGADRSLVNKFGKTARSLAIAKGHIEMCKLLREPSSSPNFLADDLLHLDKDEDISNPPFSEIFMSEPELPNLASVSKIFQEKLDNQIRNSTSSKNLNKKDETIKLLEQHGIKFLPVDQSTVVANALRRGQIAVLTEAGKLALKKTQPYVMRRIASMSNRPFQSTENQQNETTPNPNKVVDDHSNASTTTSTKRKSVDEDYANEPKVIRIDGQDLVNLTKSKKLILSRPTVNNSSPKATATSTVTNAQNSATKQKPDPRQQKSCDQRNNFIQNLQLELQKKTVLIKELKEKLEMTVQLAKQYKTKFEMKDREASLYKTQLTNLTRILNRSGIKLTAIKS